MKFDIDFICDFAMLEGRLGRLSRCLWEVSGADWGACGIQRGSEEGAKRGLGAKVALSRLWDLIFKDLAGFGDPVGTLFGRSEGVLGAPETGPGGDRET